MLIVLFRCIDSAAAVVAAICVTVLLAKSCLCAADEDDEVLEKKQLMEYYKKGLFILESEPLKRCITVDRSNLVMEYCGRPTRHMLWKWVSRHRLFNLGTSMCLGLNISNTTQPLGMFECDMSLPVLWWRCNGNMLYGASQWKVAVAGRLVVVRKNSYHEWKRYNTLREGPCSYPYEDIYTLLGNAHGMPCALPFKYNNKWYFECTTEGLEDNHRWCATTTRYDEAKRWGFCPVQDSSCERFWESNQELHACYQFNLYTILTWSQALLACQAQGGNLLSITSLAEHRYIRDRLASLGVMVWVGLNHLRDGWGWQWSDGAPLSLVNFTTALPASPLQDDSQCGVYNSAFSGHWYSLSCESALPYVCKKTPNNTWRVEPMENWQYIHTECAYGWWPHNGFCYRVLSEAGSWEESSQTCGSQGANLTSLHSLSEVEMLLNILANFSGESVEVWIGLWKQASSPTVEWSDGSPVTLTLWHQYNPPHNLTDAALCAKADREEGNWLLASCDEQLPAVCRRESQNPIHHPVTWDDGCPEGWKRHGHSCYTVTSHEQSYEDAVGYYCKDSLLTLENRFEQAFVNSLLSENGANSSMHYWIGLMDQKKKGEYSWLSHNGSSLPLTFTNWNKHQPVSAGGCVAMSGGPALGHWEVKDCTSYKALSVCKHSISSYHSVQLPEHHIDTSAPCPPGWESHSGLLHCFKVFHDEKVLMKRSWVEADFFCQVLGAQLASFHDYEEQMFVKHLLSNMFEGTEVRWFWLGLNKRDPRHPGAWQWSDGSPMVTSFIEDKNEEDNRRNCAVYSDLTNTFMPQPCDTKHEWICKVSRGDKLKKPYWYTEQGEPWVFYRGAEYLLAKQSFDWDTVSLACQMMGAYLLSIHSREELHFVKERLRRLSLGPTDWWIGLSIREPGEETRWSDKTEVNFENWAEGNGSDGPSRNEWCVTMSSSSGKWSTTKCSDRHGYVCKRKTVSVVETPREPHYIGACPEKWLYFGHKCLLLHLPGSPKEGKSWKDAQSICISFEGSLVTIEDAIEQAYITMLLQGSSLGVWIGLKDEDTMKWTNGKPVRYTNWSPVEPKSYLTGDESLCTVLSNNHNFHLTGTWYHEKCSDTGYGFVCQKPQDISKPPTHSYHHPLPDKIEYRNRSYKVVSGNMSWYDARHMCRENDSDLVSITDAYQQAFLTVLVNRLAVPHWIGLRGSGINYQWSDGSDTVYTHWDLANYDYEEGECVYMDMNGGWQTADCETPLPGTLCHFHPPSLKPFIRYEVGCPSTWVKFGHECYNLEPVVQKLTFEESREHCRQKVNISDVLTIKSETENRFILEQLSSSGFLHQTMWLGMHFNIDTDSLSWVDGSPIDYTSWANKAPDSKLLTTDTCVTTRAVDGVWHVSQCTERLGFVCKISSDVIADVKVEPINGLHHGIVPAAVLVAVLIFALLAVTVWFVYKRNSAHFHGLPTLGNAYYRHTSSQATESDGNVLITDL